MFGELHFTNQFLFKKLVQQQITAHFCTDWSFGLWCVCTMVVVSELQRVGGFWVESDS